MLGMVEGLTPVRSVGAGIPVGEVEGGAARAARDWDPAILSLAKFRGVAMDKFKLNTSGAFTRLPEHDLMAAMLERGLRDIQFIEEENKLKGYPAFLALRAASDWFFCLDNGEPYTALWVLRNLPDVEDPEGTLLVIRRRIVQEWTSERIEKLFL